MTFRAGASAAAAPAIVYPLAPMALRVRVNLVNGSTHRVLVEAERPADVLKKLRMNSAPFNDDWVEAIDGELLRVSAIASVDADPAGEDQ